MHNNRCGDIDPYIIFYLVESCGMTLEEVKQMLQTRSGLYGMSGGAGRDLRDVQAAAEAGNEDAELAIRAYCYSIKKYIGAYAAVMGGLDAIVFGGGIGLNSPLVRAMSLEGLEFLGVRLDGFKTVWRLPEWISPWRTPPSASSPSIPTRRSSSPERRRHCWLHIDK